jgi:hypothetical protein
MAIRTGTTPPGSRTAPFLVCHSMLCGRQRVAFLRRVTQPLRAAAERCSAEPDLFARPPRDDETWLSFLPRPDPDLLPPPDSLLTVA